MKAIDKKGKLFGVINIIDLLVLILIVGLVIFGAKRFTSAGPVGSSNQGEGYLTFEISDIRQIAVDTMKVGDPVYEYDKGTYIGEIVDIRAEEYKQPIEYRGRYVLATMPEKYRVYLKVKSNIHQDDRAYSVNGQDLVFGVQYRLKNKEFSAFGVLLDIDAQSE